MNSPSERWMRMRRADLLAKASDAEKYAYQILLAMGYSVVRQYPIETGRRIYFADLYIPSLNIIVECDAGYHYTRNQKRLDNNRSSGLWRLGYHVVRLSNRDAREPKKIDAKIRLILKKST